MKTYLSRKVVIKTQDNDLKQVTRNVQERAGVATVRYNNVPQRVRCAGNALDKNALWLVE